MTTSVVIDSNLYISALVFGGPPQQLFDVLRRDEARIYISPFIVGEVSGTLARKFGWTPEALDEFLPPLWERCVIINPKIRLKAVPIPTTTMFWSALSPAPPSI